MNLLNKKLKDKLQLLDDIDKQYLNNSKKKENNNVNEKNKINNINTIEIYKNSRNENFDKIYSDFFPNERSFSYYEGNLNKKKYSMSNNNCDKIPTNENSFEKEKNETFSQKELMKTISAEKNIYNNNENEKEEQSQNDINDNKLEIFDRLNNYGKLLKTKIDNLRERQYILMKERMNPRILPRSKSITRNKNNLAEKLYKDKKIKVNNKNNSCNNNIISNSSSNFTYHPQLNKKSILIAKKFEPSFTRLNKKKKVNGISPNPEKYYLNLFGNSLLNNKPKQYMNNNISFYIDNKNKKTKNIYEKMNNLYLRGMEQKHNREKKVKDSEKKKQDEYKNYSYKPKLNKNIPFDKKNGIIKKNKSKRENNFYKKNFDWKKKIEKENSKKKEKKEEIINELCTFKPKTTKFKKNNKNDKNLSKVLEQMNEYMNKRRKNIIYKNSEEKYKNKKLGIDIDGYIAKSTIPQEFELRTEMRNRDINKNKNRSCDNFHIYKNNIMIEQNSENKSLSNENEKKYWFFRENINNYNILNNNGNINKMNEAQSHFDFAEAVNFLHDKLDKLNI